MNNIDKHVRILKYPTVLETLYTISEEGKVYSVMNDDYISWGYRSGLPYVNLCCYHEDNNGNIITSMEPFYIKDLVAYNYLDNADSYIERGYKTIYKDGNPNNNNYNNITYIPNTFS